MVGVDGEGCCSLIILEPRTLFTQGCLHMPERGSERTPRCNCTGPGGLAVAELPRERYY